MSQSPDDIPSDLRRHWSRALAGAGLFDESLQVHPAQTPADTLRRGELAVLALDHATALRELKELDGDRDPGLAPDPWLELLLRAAKVMSGEPDGMLALRTARTEMPAEATVHWVVALAAQSVGALAEAGEAAAAARAGGSRDPRLLAIEAAAVVGVSPEGAEGPGPDDVRRALELVGKAQHVALADEDPAAFAADLLVKAGRPDAAGRLAMAGAGERSLPPEGRQKWHAVARGLGASGRRLTPTGGINVVRALTGRREAARRREVERSLVCRCYGSTGWLGPARQHYVDNHLTVVVPEPVAGLSARLLRCPATAILFLDFPARQITLPVSIGG
ncbi:hypothetical protein ACIB24_12255 [Spongisporangium articulatum]|uniref:DUF222 domain-containing protein n=1 Tax=Spongisporangium articulatum TaxID=3362603 RepID=A0ABW8AQB5_9ACTN